LDVPREADAALGGADGRLLQDRLGLVELVAQADDLLDRKSVV
jgi:hypothetical protein